MEIPCGIEEVENIEISGETGLLELTLMVNNEVVKNTRWLLKGIVTKSIKHPDQTKREKPNEIQEARNIMREAFEHDPEFKKTYITNISKLIINENVGNMLGELSEKILDRIFSE